MATNVPPDHLPDILSTSMRLLTLARTLCEHSKPQLDTADEFLAFSISMGLYAGADKTFRGICTLCEDGNWEVARALLRPLLETLTNIRYISKQDNIRRAKEYFCFSAIQDMKTIRAIEGNTFFDDMGVGTEELGQLARRNYDRAKRIIAEEDWSRLSRSKTWHGKTIETVMGEVGLQPAYDVVFRLTSQNIHATDASNHIELSKDHGLVLKFGPNEQWVRGVAYLSNTFFYSILREINILGRCECEQAILSMKTEVLG